MTLHEAAANGNKTALARLLAEGGEVDCRNGVGQTPLMLAAVRGEAGAVRLLLEHGADPKARESEHGRTALFYADNLDCLKLLLDHGADPGTRDVSGLPALYCLRSAEVVRALVAAGADVNTRNTSGDTALHMEEVLWSGRQHIIDCLVALGADVNARNTFGQTPVFGARAFEAVDRLVALGARLDVVDDQRQTPLHAAAARDSGMDHEVAARLLGHGLDPNAQDSRGNTLLHLAKRAETAKALLAAGASTTIRNGEGLTPLQTAWRPEIADVLRAWPGRP
jgi:ankyrin repeat protein